MEDGSQVSHRKNQVTEGGDVTEMGEDWGEVRVTGMGGSKEAEMRPVWT